MHQSMMTFLVGFILAKEIQMRSLIINDDSQLVVS